MLRVFHEADHVILDLCGRKRDVLLPPLVAVQLAEILEEKAAAAELEAPTLVKGEVWDVSVTSFDRHVALRFIPPLLGSPERVPLTVGAARHLADLLRTNADMASHGLRIEVQNTPKRV